MQSSGLVTTNKILFWVNKLDFLPKKKKSWTYLFFMPKFMPL